MGCVARAAVLTMLLLLLLGRAGLGGQRTRTLQEWSACAAVCSQASVAYTRLSSDTRRQRKFDCSVLELGFLSCLPAMRNSHRAFAPTR